MDTTATAAEKEPDPKRPRGVSLAACRTVDVSVEIPGADPETGEPAVITFVCERPSHGTLTEMKAVGAETAEDDARSVLAVMTLVTVDLRGLTDFEPRARGENREAFRARFVAYMEAAGDVAEGVLGAALNRYGEVSTPRASFRHFPR